MQDCSCAIITVCMQMYNYVHLHSALYRVDFLPPVTKIYRLKLVLDLHVQYALNAFTHMHSHGDNCTC